MTTLPRLYVLFRTAVPGILPVTRLPFVGLCRGWVVRSLSPHTTISMLKRFVNYILVDRYIDPTKLLRTYSTKWAI